jgi:hypothetical protein
MGQWSYNDSRLCCACWNEWVFLWLEAFKALQRCFFPSGLGLFGLVPFYSRLSHGNKAPPARFPCAPSSSAWKNWFALASCHNSHAWHSVPTFVSNDDRFLCERTEIRNVRIPVGHMTAIEWICTSFLRLVNPRSFRSSRESLTFSISPCLQSTRIFTTKTEILWIFRCISRHRNHYENDYEIRRITENCYATDFNIGFCAPIIIRDFFDSTDYDP